MRVTDSAVVVRTKRPDNPGHIRWEFERSGSSLTLKQAVAEGGDVTYSVSGGHGSISADGVRWETNIEFFRARKSVGIDHITLDLTKQ